MSVHYSDGTVTVHHGDCIETMNAMPPGVDPEQLDMLSVLDGTE